MSFRNIIINDRCKLNYSLNYLICRKIDEEKRVLIDEIKSIIINSTEVSITTSLIAILSQKKIKVVFCDERHNPSSELVPYQNNYYSYRKIKEQLEFKSYGETVWSIIVREKIKNQAKNLLFINKIEEYNKLISYINEIELSDKTNREGHSAKVYFNALFGKGFNRDDENVINQFLNYGYSIILSCINREIKSLGYLTELGIHHIGESNSFNLSYDLIEPLRPLVDSLVVKNIVNLDNYKIRFVELLSNEVLFNGQKMVLDNAIHLYVISIIDCLKNKDENIMKFIEYEL